MMKLYWCANTRAFRISWLLEETALPFQRVKIDIRDAASRNDPTFRAVSPLGKVPALEDGVVRLTDSGAICLYVADQYPSTALAPPIGHPDRGAYLQWVLYTNSAIEPAMIERFQKLQPNPVAHGYGTFDLVIQTLVGALDGRGPWILGERFTAADVLLGTSVQYLLQFGLVSEQPVLSAYLERCRQRPAYQRALALEKA
jgi:glutathione S-transferase